MRLPAHPAYVPQHSTTWHSTAGIGAAPAAPAPLLCPCLMASSRTRRCHQACNRLCAQVTPRALEAAEHLGRRLLLCQARLLLRLLARRSRGRLLHILRRRWWRWRQLGLPAVRALWRHGQCGDLLCCSHSQQSCRCDAQRCAKVIGALWGWQLRRSCQEGGHAVVHTP